MNHATKKSMITGTIVFFVAVFFHNAAAYHLKRYAQVAFCLAFAVDIDCEQCARCAGCIGVACIQRAKLNNHIRVVIAAA